MRLSEINIATIDDKIIVINCSGDKCQLGSSHFRKVQLSLLLFL